MLSYSQGVVLNARVRISLDELLLLQAEARGFSLLPRQPVNSLLAGRHASRLRGRGLAFEELRRYHEGDDIRTMDWKATARLRTPQVRVYTEERERPVLLIVDQRQSMFFGSQRAMKSVVAAEAAALGLWRALDGGDRVGGLVIEDDQIAKVRPHRSRQRAMQLLHEIVRANHQIVLDRKGRHSSIDGAHRLNEALKQTVQIAKHDHLIVLISDLDGADDETQRLTTRLAAHNDMIVVAVYDPLGASLQGTPGMMANDRGRLHQIPASASFTEEFRKAFQRNLDRWREIFRSLRVPVLPISTVKSVPDQVRSRLGHPTAAR
ncbi:DUF58 domain-containing protein [Roseiconus lacunae]|uniref:DUF58 domain-containing protein n=1 Tax=Roseiconus lacunae TaxID=2605694 RepID=UPI001E2FE847|nr:DUF58 domain-containing protein [Roseiconus lacunae]MCD0463304.1 DUF58 domain-containing protein [Roseiconus lacunae]